MKSKVTSPFSKEVYKKNAEIYKVLAHSTRLEIMNIIREKEVTVDDLARVIGISKTNLSQHLTILRHTGMVDVRRIGHNITYILTDPRIIEPCSILKAIHI